MKTALASLAVAATLGLATVAHATSGYVTQWYVGTSCEEFQITGYGSWISLPAETAPNWQGLHDALTYAATYKTLTPPSYTWSSGGCSGLLLQSITIPTGN